MVDERLIEKDLEGSGRGLIKILSRQLPGGTEEDTKNHNEDSRCLGRE
jgi:hypothetical protein